MPGREMAITFENPPISEVVVATYFNPSLADFRSQHVGRFWETIRNEFPVARQQVPVGSVGPPDIGPDEPFPMPRYWFIASDEISLIQIQKNAFMFNWRRRGTNQYPRYHSDIKPTFDRLYGEFETFLRTEVRVPEVTIDLCELTYVNTIKKCDLWAGPGDTERVISSFSTPSPGIDFTVDPDFNCQYIYTVASDLKLTVSIRNAVAPEQSNAAVLVFEIKASTRLGRAPKPQADIWFQRAHDTIVTCFTEMTNQDAQDNHWGRQGERLE